MDLNEIPEADKKYIGLLVSRGMKSAMDEACKNAGIKQSEFIRHCIMSKLNEMNKAEADHA